MELRNSSPYVTQSTPSVTRRKAEEPDQENYQHKGELFWDFLSEGGCRVGNQPLKIYRVTARKLSTEQDCKRSQFIGDDKKECEGVETGVPLAVLRAIHST